MKCTRCSAEVPGQSQFCLRCGTPLHAAAAPPPVRPMTPLVAPIAAPANNRSLMAVVGVLAVAVLAMAAWMVKSSLAQKPGATNAPSLVQAPAQMSARPLIQAPAASSTAPIVVALPAGVQAAPNYSDIDDYLKFVAQVERTKLNLEKKELANALITMTQTTSQQPSIAEGDDAGQNYLPGINAHNQNYADEWNKLTQIFIGRNPPQSCVQLHDKYYDHLAKTTNLFNKLHDAMAQASHGQSSDALTALTSMQGNSDAENSAQIADDELSNICQTYKLEKTFKIQAESGAGGSLLH